MLVVRPAMMGLTPPLFDEHAAANSTSAKPTTATASGRRRGASGLVLSAIGWRPWSPLTPLGTSNRLGHDIPHGRRVAMSLASEGSPVVRGQGQGSIRRDTS